ncbi:Chaperone DnaJ-domain superfamily protein, putative isoform 3 [Hibiscus syriacus]|uniref:Chaperone DnaJ-domain superfamily protein, putative isoform 3 n=1 Tax=Hibiscus syriacus TaxID=106335 RepID=A0A6A2YS20_HIBSY|nr:Chaperone DnaJ-domain superfamily protein, putative isoform 3 [Hibiscus syriacus]
MSGKAARKNLLKSCNMKGKFGNVAFIDVDGDRFENIIIIDAPESVEECLQGFSGPSSGKHFPAPDIISIDDDETDKMDNPEICKCGGDLDSEASSRKSCPASDFKLKSTGLDDDDCWFIREKRPAFKLSKCKKTYAGKTPFGKRFGLSPESEDSSSESDYSDCELIEGSVGKFQEQWEKASRRRQYNIRNGQSGLEDQTSGSGSRNDTPPGVGENASQQYAETPASSGSSGSSLQKQNSPTFEIDSDNYQDDTCLNRGTERPFVESDDKVDPESLSRSKYGPTAEAQFFHVQADVIFGRERFVKVPLSRNRNEEFSWTPSNFDPYPSDLQHGNTFANGEEKLQSKESSEEKPVEKDVNPVDVEVRTLFDESTSVKTPLDGIRVVSSKRFCDVDSFQNNGTQIRQSLSMAELSNINSMLNSKKYDESVHVQVADAIVSCKKDMIIDREKFKETDEYKQAMEEEWASRQRELKIQAEEAQRLRKRRKAESMRVLDMERRQKQRLEEMRETQKKDEENLTLKEQLRTEVRKELSKLEISCIDMASLLRGLGIPVGGGFIPCPMRFMQLINEPC